MRKLEAFETNLEDESNIELLLSVRISEVALESLLAALIIFAGIWCHSDTKLSPGEAAPLQTQRVGETEAHKIAQNLSGHNCLVRNGGSMRVESRNSCPDFVGRLHQGLGLGHNVGDHHLLEAGEVFKDEGRHLQAIEAAKQLKDCTCPVVALSTGLGGAELHDGLPLSSTQREDAEVAGHEIPLVALEKVHITLEGGLAQAGQCNIAIQTCETREAEGTVDSGLQFQRKGKGIITES